MVTTNRSKKLTTLVDGVIRIYVLCTIYRIWTDECFSQVDLVAYFANAYKSGITSNYGSIFLSSITKELSWS